MRKKARLTWIVVVRCRGTSFIHTDKPMTYKTYLVMLWATKLSWRCLCKNLKSSRRSLQSASCLVSSDQRGLKSYPHLSMSLLSPPNLLQGQLKLTGMTILRPTDEHNVSDEGIIHDEVIRNNEESITDESRGSFNAVNQWPEQLLKQPSRPLGAS